MDGGEGQFNKTVTAYNFSNSYDGNLNIVFKWVLLVKDLFSSSWNNLRLILLLIFLL